MNSAHLSHPIHRPVHPTRAAPYPAACPWRASLYPTACPWRESLSSGVSLLRGGEEDRDAVGRRSWRVRRMGQDEPEEPEDDQPVDEVEGDPGQQGKGHRLAHDRVDGLNGAEPALF